MVKGISGRTSNEESTYYKYNKRTGLNYAVKLTKSTYRNTEAQQQSRSAFRENARMSSRWLRDNRPSMEHPEGTEAYLAVHSAFVRQHRYNSLYLFVRANMQTDGIVRVSQKSEM